jgi:hypothetical protein
MMIQEKQRPAVGQISPLPTERRRSNIPKGDFTPGHQEVDQNNWEYPSQQMFFNAMKRKGHGPKENEMSVSSLFCQRDFGHICWLSPGCLFLGREGSVLNFSQLFAVQYRCAAVACVHD